MLWFIWANDAIVTVAFPFGLGVRTSTTGLVILLSALFGSVVTALAMTVFLHAPPGAGRLRQARRRGGRPADRRPAAGRLCRQDHRGLFRVPLVLNPS